MSAPPRFRAAALSDIGRVRTRNEDRILLEEKLLLFGVADGVSGLPGGATAAQTAVDAVRESVAQLAPGAEPDLATVVRGANRAVLARGLAVNPGLGIATTLTIGRLGPAGIALAHIGDSRCYAWENGRLRRVTEDHSAENEVRHHRLAGVRDRAFAAANPEALVRYLGQPGDIIPDLALLPVEAGARYLFCTDGVTRMVDERQIAGLFARSNSPEETVRRLVDLALAQGGADNASALVLSIEG